ncbi:hypothetical protein DCC39_06020 [Pueribacillus theae]|uniref:UPF0302 protein DCC39_06020 n=1 Tax=Pueribacillus theae TaxID=2171751 RepID=A0A2U1K4A3_9BACI|nr:ReoY family proteolytic degradation factor [Pueribacillus theae]PWA12357.1 hypothetical protein DCC39_06020 [Pueribacillus theae]
MNSSISIAEKKEFLKWFLKNYRFHKRECVWLINYFISDDLVMENLHFVEKAEYCPKAIILSTVCSNEVPFRFLKENIVTSDVEKSFHDIRLNPEEQVFVQLNFQHSNKNPQYSVVMEENPFLPESLHPTKQYEIWAGLILDEAVTSYREQCLYEKINEALDNKDKETFLKLTEQLKRERSSMQ